MRSHIVWSGERDISYKGVETSPQHTYFKTVRLMMIRKETKRTVTKSKTTFNDFWIKSIYPN